MIKNKQSARSLTAFLVVWSFLILTVTGIVLYIVPQGRIAHWIRWSLLGLDKMQWGAVHMMFGGVFILTGMLHLYYNWKPFKKYLLERVRGQLQIKQELIVSLVISLLILGMSIYHIPPVSWVFDLNEAVKAAWATRPELNPPFGHAEQVSLKGVSRRMQLDHARVVKRLQEAGLIFNEEDSLGVIAEQNAMTPMQVYGLFDHLLSRAQHPPLSNISLDELEVRYAGTGLGRKTLLQVCDQVGLNINLGLQRLAQQGIDATADETLKEVAERHARSPLELLKLMLTEE
ncbi:MAG: DUF4405 domain-containing protein [Gammaproteobacteria bacterium]|nr:DUF4405 domain-containing protein [Gammaproteobacteria bacterium]